MIPKAFIALDPRAIINSGWHNSTIVCQLDLHKSYASFGGLSVLLCLSKLLHKTELVITYGILFNPDFSKQCLNTFPAFPFSDRGLLSLTSFAAGASAKINNRTSFNLEIELSPKTNDWDFRGHSEHLLYGDFCIGIYTFLAEIAFTMATSARDFRSAKPRLVPDFIACVAISEDDAVAAAFPI